jgi:hypothetical protein
MRVAKPVVVIMKKETCIIQVMKIQVVLMLEKVVLVEVAQIVTNEKL